MGLKGLTESGEKKPKLKKIYRQEKKGVHELLGSWGSCTG